MGKIVALTNTTNVVVNNDFWNKANQMLSEYLTEIKKITPPEKPGSSEMELPWIYEVMQLSIPELFSGDLVLLDGDMAGQLIYNLALGASLSVHPKWGSLITVNDPKSQDLIKTCSDNPFAEQRYKDITIVEAYSDPSNQGDEMLLSESIFRILAAKEITGVVVIDRNIDSKNKIVQILLGILYYLGIEVLYKPENSNAFIDFITAS